LELAVPFLATSTATSPADKKSTPSPSTNKNSIIYFTQTTTNDCGDLTSCCMCGCSTTCTTCTTRITTLTTTKANPTTKSLIQTPSNTTAASDAFGASDASWVEIHTPVGVIVKNPDLSASYVAVAGSVPMALPIIVQTPPTTQTTIVHKTIVENTIVQNKIVANRRRLSVS
jgi:hypothetical protein